MKTKFNLHKKAFAGLMIAVMALSGVLTSCEKDSDMDLPLAVSARNLSLKKDAGSTHVLVYSTGDWTARFTREVDWASLNKLKGYGNNEIVFTYAANYGVSRQVGVIFERGSLADTVMFTQAGSVTDPSLLFTKSAVTLLKAPSKVFAPITTNMRYSVPDIKASVIYYDLNGDATDTMQVVPRPDVAAPDAWIGNVSIGYKGVNYEVTENETGFPRTADLKIYIADAAGIETYSVLTITQNIALPVFGLDSTDETYEGFEQECLVTATNNNIAPYSNQVEIEVVYDTPVEEGEEWIMKPQVTDEGLAFLLRLNDTSAARSATVSLTYTDALGVTVAAQLRITQKLYPAATDFATVRAMAPGVITETKFIDGFVVSDLTSKNVVSSPQTAQFMFDRTENDRTAYFESPDGRYGFCLKFATAEDNTLARFSKARIALTGLTLVQMSNPERYILTGLTAENILESSVPDEFSVPVKNKTIAQLTDDDIYTLVSVTDLEIMCKDGAYTNCTDGYSLKDELNTIGSSAAPRWDVAPLMCYDKAGNTIFMLTNAAVSWRRFSSGHDIEFNSIVAQGSGTFRGVVVADEVAPIRYGDLGRYQLRAMTKDDIALTDAPFATTLVEWNWNDRKNDLTPEVGAGEILKYEATQSATADFNNVVCSGNGGSTSEQKGLVPNAGVMFTQQWWDFTAGEGKYFDISFSTQGISGSNLIFGIVWGHGAMNNTTIFGPAHWNLLYSTDDGATFAPVPNAPMLKKRSVAWWSTTSQDATPGFTEHLRKLPADCFGKAKVILRLQVADTVTDIVPSTSASTYLTNLGIELGTLTPSVAATACQVRIGTITVRYN